MITIFVLTIGEKSTFNCLNSIIKYANKEPYEIKVWYDTCGKEVDTKFYKRLRKYTDDIIISTQNQGLPRCFGYGLLYFDTQYILLTAADVVFEKDFLAKLMTPFTDPSFGKVACVGNIPEGYLLSSEYVINDDSTQPPDFSVLIKKDAINDVGSFSPSFKMYYQEFAEWMLRARHKEWNIVSTSGTSRHFDNPQEGHKDIEGIDDIIERNVNLVRILKEKLLKNEEYSWWKNNLGGGE